MAYPELLKYVFRVTDELMQQEVDSGNTLMIDYQQKANPYNAANVALQKKKMMSKLKLSRVAPAPSTKLHTHALDKLVVKPQASLHTNSTDSINSNGSGSSSISVGSSVSSNMKKMKASVKAFSLTDFLLDREKEKTLETLNAQLSGKIKKLDNDDDLKEGWDDKIGKTTSTLMTEAPETWGWA